MDEYVGFDVSKEEASFCVMDRSGKILAQGKALSDPGSLFEALREHTLCPQRIVLETGTLSGWLARGLREHGLAVDVIDARQAHAVMKLQHNKTDANDAVLLAEIARSGFCRPVSVNSEASQKHRILIKARRHLASSGVPEARYGERDTGLSLCARHSLSQGLWQVGRAGSGGLGRAA